MKQSLVRSWSFCVALKFSWTKSYRKNIKQIPSWFQFSKPKNTLGKGLLNLSINTCKTLYNFTRFKCFIFISGDCNFKNWTASCHFDETSTNGAFKKKNKFQKMILKVNLTLPYTIIKCALLLKLQWKENDIIINPCWRCIFLEIPEEFLSSAQQASVP